MLNTGLPTGEYTCPVHGDIGPDVLISGMRGHEGAWCMRCLIEALERLGVKRAIPKIETRGNG